MNKYIVKTIFTKKECVEILKMKTKMVSRLTTTPKFEESFFNGALLDLTEEVILVDSWVHDRLMENMDIGNFANCDGIWPHYKLHTYQVGDELGLHTDGVRGIKRVAVSICLNDDYDGGDPKFLDWNFDMNKYAYQNFDINTVKDNIKVITIKSEVGLMVQYPITTPHGVTKITKGVRKQLVTWFTGEYLNW